jgi:hypothetical protein
MRRGTTEARRAQSLTEEGRRKRWREDLRNVEFLGVEAPEALHLSSSVFLCVLCASVVLLPA